ncbi:hypothetical protein PG997_000494 [Apiospora hydei]|uniref:Uncharacterized protein n=1 Tax=Apiospora hydei TaxID=1337664 RepID=A0ABR1XB00_9PEZI
MAIFTTLLALISVILRNLVPLKTRRNPDRADGLANLAMVLALVELGLTMTASLNGLGDLPSHPLQSQEQRENSGKAEYPFPVHYAIISSHFYLLSSMTAKAAACLMCLKVMAPRKGDNENMESFLTLGLTTTATRASIGAEAGDRVIVIALRVHGAWSAASDLVLALFPTLFLSRLAMLAKKRAALWGIMGFGVIVAACAVVKCVHGDNLYKTILWGSLCRGLTMSTTTTTSTSTSTTAKTKTIASVSQRRGEEDDNTIFLESLSNMHGRQKGSWHRRQITIQSSSHCAGDGESARKDNNKKKGGGVFLHALERLRTRDPSSSSPGDGGEANNLATGSQRNLIWCGSDCTADRRSEKGDTEPNKKGQEGNNIPRGNWIESGIMKTVSIRVNSGENFDVELWELGARER